MKLMGYNIEAVWKSFFATEYPHSVDAAAYGEMCRIHVGNGLCGPCQGLHTFPELRNSGSKEAQYLRWSPSEYQSHDICALVRRRVVLSFLD